MPILFLSTHQDIGSLSCPPRLPEIRSALRQQWPETICGPNFHQRRRERSLHPSSSSVGSVGERVRALRNASIKIRFLPHGQGERNGNGKVVDVGERAGLELLVQEQQEAVIIVDDSRYRPSALLQAHGLPLSLRVCTRIHR